MKDTHLQESNKKWEFNQQVTDVFETMLENSIPQYHMMRSLVLNLSDRLTNRFEFKRVLDIGCSNGLSLQDYVNRFDNASFVGVDVSEPMLKMSKERFSNKENVTILNCDLRHDYPCGEYNLITSILSIQFTPIEYRQQIIQNIYDSLEENGVFVFVEKILGDNNAINNALVGVYLDLKEENGYTKEQIDRKKESLEGVLVPMTSKWNKELLQQAGFKKIDSFWRCLNFEGYVAIK